MRGGGTPRRNGRASHYKGVSALPAHNEKGGIFVGGDSVRSYETHEPRSPPPHLGHPRSSSSPITSLIYSTAIASYAPLSASAFGP